MIKMKQVVTDGRIQFIGEGNTGTFRATVADGANIEEAEKLFSHLFAFFDKYGRPPTDRDGDLSKLGLELPIVEKNLA